MIKKTLTTEEGTIKLFGIKAIKKMVETGELTSPQFQKLYEIYQNEMSYGTQKARTGDPDQFILAKLVGIVVKYEFEKTMLKEVGKH